MTKGRLLASALAAVVLSAAQGALARGQPTAPSSAEAVLKPFDHPAVVTKHVGVFNGQKVKYTATVAGTDVGTGAAQARVVSFAYTRDGADPSKRPVLFLFNGGPIVASEFVHIGGLGPKRLSFPDDVTASPSSFRLIDNRYSPLDAVDLVFVDPASTGFSRVANGTRPSAFYSVKADARQLADFVSTWIKANGRTGAPIYLLGESYGTNRVAEMAGQLAEGPDPLPLAGVYLYGQAVNIIEYAQRPANNTSFVASLPTVAAIGWYHGKAERKGRTFQQYLADARAFAKGPYLTGLYRGSDLSDAERADLAAKLQEYSGIPAAWYLAHDLKISKEQLRVELLKDQKLLLGRSDARYVAPITDKGGALDPSDVLSQAVMSHFEAYLRDDLKITWTEPYLTFAPNLGSLNDWNWGENTTPFGDWPYQSRITKMMNFNPNFRLFIGNGYYDTQTTMGAAEMLAVQSGWDKSRVSLRYYDGGHMGYSVDATAKGLADDLRQWVSRP